MRLFQFIDRPCVGIRLVLEISHAFLVCRDILGDCTPYLEVERTGAFRTCLLLQLGLQVSVSLFVFSRQSLELSCLHVRLHLAKCLFCHIFQHIAHALKGSTPVYIQGKALGIHLAHGGVTLLFECLHLPLFFISSASTLIHLLNLFSIFLGNGILLFLYGSILLQIVCHGKQLILQGFLVGFLDGLSSAFLVQGVRLVNGIGLFRGKSICTSGNACFLVISFPCGFLLVYLVLLSLIVVFYLAKFLFQAFLHGINFFLVIFTLQFCKFLTHLFLGLLAAFFRCFFLGSCSFRLGCCLLCFLAVFVRTRFA